MASWFRRSETVHGCLGAAQAGGSVRIASIDPTAMSAATRSPARRPFFMTFHKRSIPERRIPVIDTGVRAHAGSSVATVSGFTLGNHEVDAHEREGDRDAAEDVQVG